MRQTQVQKWGNSLAIRIPKPFAAELGLGQNSAITVSVVEGKLMVEPVKPTYTLADLLAQVKPENLHQEIETGQGLSNEVW